MTNPQPLPVEDGGPDAATLERVRQRIVGYLRTRHPELAEDIAQDCMLLLHRRYGHVRSIEDLVPIGITIAKHKIREETRKKAKQAHQMEDGFEMADTKQKTGEQVMVETAAVHRLQAAIRGLGPDCQRLLQMMLQQKRTDEMCELLGIKSGALHTRLCRCRKKLSIAMGWAG